MKSNFDNTNNEHGDATVENLINQLIGDAIQKQQEEAEAAQKGEADLADKDKYFELDGTTKEKIDALIKELKTICDENNIPFLTMYQTRNSEDSYGMHRAQVRVGLREVTEFHLIHELVEIMFDSASDAKSRFVKEGLVTLLMLANGL